MKLINDPVYGLIHIRTPLLFDLIEHPLFQRLRRIRQTGFTHLVYPGSQHTRFHHALGAMHLMGMAIDELRNKQTEISDEEEEAALIAVLLHDIGHSPYSHALEGLIIRTDHESIGKIIFQYLAQSLGPQLTLAYQIFTGTYHRPFLHQLISGQLDLDRLDYLSRDSFYTGVAEGVVGHDRILRMLRVVDNQLVVEEKGLYSIEKFLVARRIMYWQVYLHKTSLAAELMAKHLIISLSEEPDSKRSPFLADELNYFLKAKTDLRQFEAHQQEILETFKDLDDTSVDYSIKRLRSYGTPDIAYLATSIFQRKIHKVKWFEQPVEDAVISQYKSDCIRKYGWSEDTASKLIWTGHETKDDYVSNDEEINILMKSGEIKPFSSLLQAPLKIASHKKYFICHPSVI